MSTLTQRDGLFASYTPQGALSAPRRRGRDRQSFIARGVGEPLIERNKRHHLSELALQVEAARELHGVASPQTVAEKERPRPRDDLRCALDEDQRGEVVLQGCQRPVPFLLREGPFAGPPNQRGGDFDFRPAT